MAVVSSARIADESVVEAGEYVTRADLVDDALGSPMRDIDAIDGRPKIDPHHVADDRGSGDLSHADVVATHGVQAFIDLPGADLQRFDLHPEPVATARPFGSYRGSARRLHQTPRTR